MEAHNRPRPKTLPNHPTAHPNKKEPIMYFNKHRGMKDFCAIQVYSWVTQKTTRSPKCKIVR